VAGKFTLGTVLRENINMKAAAIVFATLGLAMASAAVASERFTDLDYLKANRCKGLSASLGTGDTAALDATIKAEGRTRADAILQRAQDELSRGKKDGAKTDLKDRVTAELNGPCLAYTGGSKDTASAR
jgi:hypothetical protein